MTIVSIIGCSEESKSVTVYSVEYSSYGFEPKRWRDEVRLKLQAAGVPAEEKLNPISGEIELVWPKSYDAAAEPILKEVTSWVPDSEKNDK